MMTGGIDVMTAPAIIWPQKKTSCPSIVWMPTMAVRESTLLMKTRAYKNSFHDSVNEKSATTATAGSEMGIVTRRSAPRRVQPSIRAASSSSAGMLLKYPTSSHVQNGTVKLRYTSIRLWILFARSSVDTIVNIGMKSSEDGTRYARIRLRATRLRPRKVRRAIAYPPSAPKMTDSTVVNDATTALFRTQPRNGPRM